MANFISKYFKKDFEQKGVFDALLDVDSHYFINITRLKVATTPEFKNSYEKINEYFRSIAKLLMNAKEKSLKDKCYKSAIKRFHFSEVNDINLGFAKSVNGSAFGKVLTEKIMSDAYDIVKAGTKDPEFFHLLSLFEENVGPDRLSDMIATIVFDDIRAYTRRINQELGIDSIHYPDEVFNDGIVRNPFKKCQIFLLPKEILHELPIAEDWYDVKDVVCRNEVIRSEVNEIIGKEWKKIALAEKKRIILEDVLKDPNKSARVLDAYRQSHTKECDWESDINYIAKKIFLKFDESVCFNLLKNSDDKIPLSSSEAMKEILSIFKTWVEYHKGWFVILDSSTKHREKIVQSLLHLTAERFVNENNLDISFESNAGRGHVDLKISIGSDKSLCEVKLSTNPKYLHGYEKQLIEYGLAEGTDNLFYLFIDVDNSGKTEKLQELHRENMRLGKKCPELIIIDATKKKSASIW